MANYVHAFRSICCLSSPSHLRLLNGQAKVRYCHNAVAIFRDVTEVPTGHTYVQTIGTRDRARHVASRRICPHIHILCMPVCVPMSARPRSGSPHDDLHRSSVGLITSELKGLTKKLSIPSRYKENASSFFNQLLLCNVCRYGLHYNVLLGLMTSV